MYLKTFKYLNWFELLMIIWNNQFKNFLRIKKWTNIYYAIIYKQNDIWVLFTIDTILWCCNFRLTKNFFMKKINKKYAEIMHQADHAVGRKEVVSLLKKAAIIMSKSEEKLAA